MPFTVSMYRRKKLLAIIPARAGSKGLPGKNVKMLCGKPLLAWSVESARNSKYLDEVMVSTDSEEIAEVARQYGGSVPFLRPEPLSTDESPTFDAVEHVLQAYAREFARSFDYVVLLEPTSPLREKGDIDAMVERLVDRKDCDSIISIGEVGEHPAYLKRIRGEDLLPYCAELAQTTRRQDNEPAYFPYGVAYIAKTESLLREKTFYCGKSLFYKIMRHQCREIDDIYDFLAVESVMRYRETQ